MKGVFGDSVMWWTVLTTSATFCYCAIYLYSYSQKPKLYCKINTKLHELLKRNVSSINSRYWALFWCYESRCITILRYFVPVLSRLKYTDEVCQAGDGGEFCIKWANQTSTKREYIVILVPGVTSHCYSNYVYSIVSRLHDEGYQVGVVTHRGVFDTKVKTPKTYCATHTIDLAATISLVSDRYPSSKIFGIGASLGGMILAQYLEETGEKSKLTAAVLFSCPFHPNINCKRLEHNVNNYLINKPVASTLKRNYSKHRHLFKDLVNHKKVMDAPGIKEFDHAFTVPVFGYRSVEHYYEACRVGKERLSSIKIPTLCVNADDDVFSEESTLPKLDIENTDHVAMVVTKGGGHVSHMQGLNPFQKTFFEQILLEYLSAISCFWSL